MTALHQSILVVGSLNMDEVVRVPRMPALGETLLGAGSLRMVPGGKGANQAVAMARLGGQVRMAGRVGADAFGESLRGSLQADSIDAALVVVDRVESTGVAFIFLAPDGSNAIVVASGANMQVGHDQQHLASIHEAVVDARALVLQLEIPLDTVAALAAVAHDAGVRVILNLAPAQRLPAETLRQIEMLVVNEHEASLLSGRRVASVLDARSAAALLYEQGIARVVITLGEQGAVMASAAVAGDHAARVIHQAAPAVQVVDTTAAGDCFVGALTVALTEGQAPEEALRFAVFASALKVTKFGAQSGLPTRLEVEAFLRRGAPGS
jgi:ribokinase